MILISCIDDRGGLLFHGRRLSRDRVLCQDVLRTCAGSPLWMAPGSRSLFSSLRDGLSAPSDLGGLSRPGRPRSSAFWRTGPSGPSWTEWSPWSSITGTAATPRTCFWTWTRPPWGGPCWAGRNFPGSSHKKITKVYCP